MYAHSDHPNTRKAIEVREPAGPPEAQPDRNAALLDDDAQVGLQARCRQSHNRQPELLTRSGAAERTRLKAAKPSEAPALQLAS